MLLFIVDTLASNFNNIKEMMNNSIEKRKGKWFNAVEEYRLELGLTWNRLNNIDRQSLKKTRKEVRHPKLERRNVQKD